MNVFDLRQRLVSDYARYTRSFIKIADPTILAEVDSELDAGAFWPEPLGQEFVQALQRPQRVLLGTIRTDHL